MGIVLNKPVEDKLDCLIVRDQKDDLTFYSHLLIGVLKKNIPEYRVRLLTIGNLRGEELNLRTDKVLFLLKKETKSRTYRVPVWTKALAGSHLSQRDRAKCFIVHVVNSPSNDPKVKSDLELEISDINTYFQWLPYVCRFLFPCDLKCNSVETHGFRYDTDEHEHTLSKVSCQDLNESHFRDIHTLTTTLAKTDNSQICLQILMLEESGHAVYASMPLDECYERVLEERSRENFEKSAKVFVFTDVNLNIDEFRKDSSGLENVFIFKKANMFSSVIPLLLEIGYIGLPGNINKHIATNLTCFNDAVLTLPWFDYHESVTIPVKVRWNKFFQDCEIHTLTIERQICRQRNRTVQYDGFSYSSWELAGSFTCSVTSYEEQLDKKLLKQRDWIRYRIVGNNDTGPWYSVISNWQYVY